MKQGERIGFLNLSVLFLSVYVLVALAVDTFWSLSFETSRLLTLFDYGICTFFLFEFVYRFQKAGVKSKFIRKNWIDLVSCIPMVDFLRAGRLLRLVRLLRIIRSFRTIRNFANHVFANKARGALNSVSVLAILLIIFSAIAILQFEDHPESNISTAEDAIWWVYTTITTVGYGDKYPITTEGRVIAMALMTFGVGLFGTFTAYVASMLSSTAQAAQHPEITESPAPISQIKKEQMGEVGVN